MTSSPFRKFFVLGLAILAGFCLTLAAPSRAQAQLLISVGTPPPPLPYYEQPFVPGPDYIWSPGYWAWGQDGYYWVPGAWVLAPQPGLLWTPGYWAWDDFNDAYYWHPGYWARRVGYYGGINYGYGYYGRGYAGGRWYGPHFRYNTVVTRVNTTIVRNVYVDRTVVVNNPVRTVTRVSFNGGKGGIVAQPLASERAPRHEIPMTALQREHEHVASIDRNQLASVTHDQPRQVAAEHAFTAQQRPATFERVRPADRVVPQPTPARVRPHMNPGVTPSNRAPTHAPAPAIQQPSAPVPQARMVPTHPVAPRSRAMRPARENPAPMRTAPVRPAPAHAPPPRVVAPPRAVTSPPPPPRAPQPRPDRDPKSAQ